MSEQHHLINLYFFLPGYPGVENAFHLGKESGGTILSYLIGKMFSLFCRGHTSVLSDWILKLFGTHNFYLRIFKTQKPQILFSQRLSHSFNFIFLLLFKLSEAWFFYSYNVNYLGTALYTGITGISGDELKSLSSFEFYLSSI